jgi:hypothetical protein
VQYVSEYIKMLKTRVWDNPGLAQAARQLIEVYNNDGPMLTAAYARIVLHASEGPARQMLVDVSALGNLDDSGNTSPWTLADLSPEAQDLLDNSFKLLEQQLRETLAAWRQDRILLARLLVAADTYTADQTGAEDSRVGLVQPVTVAEAEALNAAVAAAWARLGTAEVERLLQDKE